MSNVQEPAAGDIVHNCMVKNTMIKALDRWIRQVWCVLAYPNLDMTLVILSPEPFLLFLAPSSFFFGPIVSGDKNQGIMRHAVFFSPYGFF